jgi:hypothetical protein
VHLVAAKLSDLHLVERHFLRGFDKIFSDWDMVLHLIEAKREELAPGVVDFEFADLARLFGGVREKLGKFVQATDCERLESELVSMEEGNGTGRVTLHDFYASTVGGKGIHLVERPEYLRQLGALDESDPSGARVLIPNYISTRANCIAEASVFYGICCADSSCRDLFGHLESRLRAPHASPEQILSVLLETSSPHSAVNRSWSRALVSKLEEIAEHHEGHVPLHGRLFAQWLHFAYPRECMYPHASDMVFPMTDAQWEAETGAKPSLSEKEMRNFIVSGAPSSRAQQPCDEEEELCFGFLWMSEEELVDPVHGRAPPPSGRQEGSKLSLMLLLRLGALAALTISVGVIWRNHWQQVTAALLGQAPCDKALRKPSHFYV